MKSGEKALGDPPTDNSLSHPQAAEKGLRHKIRYRLRAKKHSSYNLIWEMVTHGGKKRLARDARGKVRKRGEMDTKSHSFRIKSKKNDGDRKKTGRGDRQNTKKHRSQEGRRDCDRTSGAREKVKGGGVITGR